MFNLTIFALIFNSNVRMTVNQVVFFFFTKIDEMSGANKAKLVEKIEELRKR